MVILGLEWFQLPRSELTLNDRLGLVSCSDDLPSNQLNVTLSMFELFIFNWLLNVRTCGSFIIVLISNFKIIADA